MIKRIVFMSSTLHRDPQTRKVINTIISRKLNIKIPLIIGDKEKKDVRSMRWAEKRGIPIVFIETEGKTASEMDCEIILEIEKYGGADYVFLIGWMKYLGLTFLNKFKNKAANIHPSILPSFNGLSDWRVHEAVIAACVKISGCTLHFVDETVDGGPIIIQESVPVYSSDTPAELRKRVQRKERHVILKTICLLIENRVKVEGKKVIILDKPQNVA